MGSVGGWRLASASHEQQGVPHADGRRSAEVGGRGPLQRRLGGTSGAYGPVSCPADGAVGDPDGEDGHRPPGDIADSGARARPGSRERYSPCRPALKSPGRTAQGQFTFAGPARTAVRYGSRVPGFGAATRRPAVTGDLQNLCGPEQGAAVSAPGPALRWLSG